MLHHCAIWGYVIGHGEGADMMDTFEETVLPQVFKTYSEKCGKQCRVGVN